MPKNDTLKNGTSRIGLYGSAPPADHPISSTPPNKILIVHMVKDRVAYRAPYHQRGAKKICHRVPGMSQNIHQIKLEGVRTRVLLLFSVRQLFSKWLS